MNKLDTEKVVAVPNRILEAELAGVVRYTHYSFLVFTALGAYPSLEIGELLDSHKTDIGAMLRKPGDLAAFAPRAP